MVDNFMTEWEQRERRPPLVLVDSYGNKGKGYMPAYFVSAFWCVLINGLCGRIGLLHLHMAECGSVLRKGLLLWLARLLRVPAVVHVHAAEFVDFYAALPRFYSVSYPQHCGARPVASCWVQPIANTSSMWWRSTQDAWKSCSTASPIRTSSGRLLARQPASCCSRVR